MNVLHAIRWVADAWKSVAETTIKKCFRKAGILAHDFSVVSLLVSAETDPFSNIDNCDYDESDDAGCDELAKLIHRVHGSENASSVSEFLAAICSEFTESSWDEEFMAEIGPQSKEVCTHDDEDGDQDTTEDVEPPPPRLKNLREVMESLEDVRSYLELNGHTDAATKAEDLVNTGAWLQCSSTNSTIQSKITLYFPN